MSYRHTNKSENNPNSVNADSTTMSSSNIVQLGDKTIEPRTERKKVVRLGSEHKIVGSLGYTNSGYMDHDHSDFSVLDELEDYEINPKAPQILTKNLIRDQISEYLNINKNPDRVLPVWREPVKLHTVGILSDTYKAQAYSSALNNMSLLSDMELKQVKLDDPSLNAMVLFINGKEQICLDQKCRDAIEAVNMDSKTIYEKIEQNLTYDKQATEYRFVRYSGAGVSFFLNIVDVSWIQRLEKNVAEKADIFDAQIQNIAFRIFSLQDGVADSVKYSHMNHKYFWKRMKDYAPVDKSFIRTLYGKKMKSPRTKQQAAKCLTYYIWKELSGLEIDETPKKRLLV